ncbi:MAG: GAF domain-containing protein [Anaerolineales bacterium]|nr:GAF domain-containing protein [Anaerolineales bacterium]
MVITIGFVFASQLIQDEQAAIWLSDISFPITSLLTTLASGYAALRLRSTSRQLAIAWGLIALGYFFNTLAEIIWGIIELALGRDPFPSLADFFYLLLYPCLIAGVLMLPRARLASSQYPRILIEMAMVMLSSSVFYWNLILGESVVALGSQNTQAGWVGLAYQVFDLILIWLLFGHLLWQIGHAYFLPYALLTLSGLSLIVADSLFIFLSRMGYYHSGSPLDAAWLLAFLLAGLAGLTLVAARPSDAPSETGSIRSLRWWALLVYAWPLAAFLLLFLSDRQVLVMSQDQLVLSVGLIIALVITRQFIALRENRNLYTRLEQEFAGRLQALENLQESEARIKQFMEAIPDAVFVVDRDGFLIYANTTAHAMIVQELASSRCVEQLPRALQLYKMGTHHLYPSQELPIERALKGESGVVDDIEMPGSQGRRLMEMHATPVWGANQQVQYAMAVLHNITPRIEMEETLSVQRDLFEKLVQVARATATSPTLEATVEGALGISLSITGAEKVSLFMVDLGGVVMYRLLENGELEYQKRGVADQVMDEGLAGWVFKQQQTAIVPDTHTDERWIRLKDDSAALRSALVVPITHSNDRLGVLSVYHTKPFWFSQQHLEFLSAAADQIAPTLRNARIYEEQRHMAEELAEAKKAAEAANQAKSIFLARTSHELRTPLAIILGYTEILQEEIRRHGYDELLPRLDKVQDASQHLLDLINDVLDFSRLDRGSVAWSDDLFSVVDLVKVVSGSVRSWVDRNNNTLVIDCPPDAGTMKTDLRRLRQILYNLLQNACKFTSNGTITLTVKREWVDGGDWIHFTVADTGIGMDEEQVMRLFHPFALVDHDQTSEFGGIGLGLAITHRLVEIMGGRISVSSQVNQGTTMVVSLPAEQMPSAQDDDILLG